jgi:hypothetical protein
MGDKANWRIHVWQITVPVGDCAIHLLVEEQNIQKDIVHRAVLIDGGKYEDSAVSTIIKIIYIINFTYQFALDKNFEDPDNAKKRNLRFDSIVITHWDWDHYDGVLGILKKGFDISRSKFKAQLDSKFSSTWDKTALTIIIPNWFCKYKTVNIDSTFGIWNDPPDKAFVTAQGAALTKLGGDNNLTTIYVPYSITKAKRTKSMRQRKGDLGQAWIAGRSGPWGVQGSSTNHQFLIRGLYDVEYSPTLSATGPIFASLGPRYPPPPNFVGNSIRHINKTYRIVRSGGGSGELTGPSLLSTFASLS